MISGSIERLGMDKFKFVWMSMDPKNSTLKIPLTNKTSRNSFEFWVLSPIHEPIFGSKNGACKTKPPIAFVNQILDALALYSYKVVGFSSTNSIGTTKKYRSAGCFYALIFEWVLNSNCWQIWI